MSDITPEVLYHYTDQAGLLGIVEGGKLWASQIQYLNDTEELKLALEIARQALMESPEQTKKLQIRGVTIDDIIKRFDVFYNHPTFICSFSESKDSLSQWRGYSKGMAGCCIGFDLKQLDCLISDSGNNRFSLKKCIYEPSEQKKLILKVVNSITSEIDEGPSHNGTFNSTPYNTIPYNSGGVFVSLIHNELSKVVPLIKHHSFKEESEWRLISQGRVKNDDFHFRVGSSMLIPYLRVSVGRELIRELIVGHTPNASLAEMSVKALVSKYSLDSKVQVSNIPYRSW